MDSKPASTASGTGGFVAGQKVGAGRYTLIQFLGKGGMGVVWLARDEHLEDEVALKFLTPEIAHDADALDDMRRETLKSRKLSHPNIIRIHDFHQSPGEAPFISMEFIDGAPLSTLKTRQPDRLFSWDQIKPWVQQLCSALDYAHSQKVIHRDLKPGNLMVTKEGFLKLADFGISATASDSRSRLTRQMGSSGTPAYMSPQQMSSAAPKPSDDIYALGAMLYELLTSKPPFYTGDIIHQVKEQEPPTMERRLADLGLSNVIPDEVNALIMACLSKQPEQRPAGAKAVADRVGLEFVPVIAPQWWWIHRWRLLMAGAAVLVLILAAGYWAGNHRREESGIKVPLTDVVDRIEPGWAPVFSPGSLLGTPDPGRWRWSGNVLLAMGTKRAAILGAVTHTNVQVKAEVRFRRGPMSSIVLRAAPNRKPPPPLSGYIVKLGGVQKEYRLTGTLMNQKDVLDEFVKEDEWFTVHSIVVGNRVIVRLNGRTVLDYVDADRKFDSGKIGLTHGEGTAIMFRNIRAQALSADEAEALKEVRKEVSDLK